MSEARERRTAPSWALVAIAVLAAVGAGISGYLSFTQWAGVAPYCAGAVGCEIVLASPYAHIGALPLASLGLAMYLALLALSVGFLMGRQWRMMVSILALAVAGTLYSAYLTYVSVALLRALCPWCLASTATISLILGLALYASLRGPGSSERQQPPLG